MKKLLKRHTFIRERDFKEHLRKEALRWGYHRVWWQPIEVDHILKDIVWLNLQGRDIGDSMFFADREIRDRPDVPTFATSSREAFCRRYIEYLRSSKRLWNPEYRRYSWRWGQNSIDLRYRKDFEWEPMGIAFLERDYELAR